MRFFRRKCDKGKLAELLLKSGSLFKAGLEKSRRHNQSLDDIYGWSDQNPSNSDGNLRIGLPAVRIKKTN